VRCAWRECDRDAVVVVAYGATFYIDGKATPLRPIPYCTQHEADIRGQFHVSGSKRIKSASELG
jgi:hypothetical protein